MDLSLVTSWVFTIIFYEVIALGLVCAIVYWRYGQQCKGKPFVALIRRTNGFTTEHLCQIEDEGRSIKVDGGTYILSKEMKDSVFPLDPDEKKKYGDSEVAYGKHPEERPEPYTGQEYPTRLWVRWPSKPFLGFSFLQRILRAELWDEGNPEPVRSFYGTINKKGEFVGHLHATASEITSMKNVAEAAGIVGQVEEAREIQKVMNKALLNQPNKMYLYIGMVILIVLGIVGVFYSYSIASLITGG